MEVSSMFDICAYCIFTLYYSYGVATINVCKVLIISAVIYTILSAIFLESIRKLVSVCYHFLVL